MLLNERLDENLLSRMITSGTEPKNNWLREEKEQKEIAEGIKGDCLSVSLIWAVLLVPFLWKTEYSEVMQLTQFFTRHTQIFHIFCIFLARLGSPTIESSKEERLIEKSR